MILVLKDKDLISAINDRRKFLCGARDHLDAGVFLDRVQQLDKYISLKVCLIIEGVESASAKKAGE